MKTILTLILLTLTLTLSGQVYKSLPEGKLYKVENSIYTDTVKAGVLLIDSVPGYYNQVQIDTIDNRFYKQMLDSFYNIRAGGGGASVNCPTYDLELIGGGTTITSCCGTITDGTGNYENSNNIGITINNSGIDDHITLHFTEFATESGSDFLRIYENEGGTLLYEYSGSSIPSDLSISCPQIYILFYSDSGVVGTGFSVNFKVYNTSTTSLCD